MLVNACAQLTIYKIVSLVVRLGRDWERCRFVVIILQRVGDKEKYLKVLTGFEPD